MHAGCNAMRLTQRLQANAGRDCDKPNCLGACAACGRHLNVRVTATHMDMNGHMDVQYIHA